MFGNCRLLLAVGAVVCALAGVVGAAVVLLPEDAPPPVVEMPSGLTGTPITDPTPVVHPAGVPTPTSAPAPLSPSVDTSRAVPAGQTTLLEVDTGQVLRWENGENVQNPRFSPDSRWLVYNEGWVPGENDLAWSRIYRVDLTADELRPYLIGAGFNPSISSRGDIAFNRQIDGQRAIVLVATTDGTIRQMQGIGATFTAPSWSPDGRWLVFAAGYDSVNPMTITLVDTSTWLERQVGEWITGPGDSGYSPEWSPDSRFFLHDRRYLTTAATGEVTRVDGAVSWLSGSVYMQYETHPQTHFVTAGYSVDLNTGQRAKLFEGPGDAYMADYPGAGLLAFIVQETRPGFATPSYYRITTLSGESVIEKLPGQQLRVWNGYLFTSTSDRDGCNGLSIWRMDGSAIRCIDRASYTVRPESEIVFSRVVRPATPQLRIPAGDVYLMDIETGAEKLLLMGQEGTCLRWSPDYRWLVADDFCDTI